MHTAEPLVPEPNPFQVLIVIAKWGNYKCPSINQIPAKLIQAGGDILRSGVHKLVNLFGVRKNCLSNGRSLLLNQFTRRAIKVPSNYRGMSLLLTTYEILPNILHLMLSPFVDKIMGDHPCVSA
jgi:hypothetical protein